MVDLNIKIDKDKKGIKKSICTTCKGNGKVEVNKALVPCPICGGSGDKDKINTIGNKMLLQKGKPQIKYEVTIKDTETNKVIYKGSGYGGVIASVDEIFSFSAKEVEGNFQSAMWGNPLIQRFAIDRLEEVFAREIDNYVDSLEENGMTSTNREQMKQMLIEGNQNLLLKRMREKNPSVPSSQPTSDNGVDIEAEAIKTDELKEKAQKEYIQKATEIMKTNNKFVLLAIDHSIQQDGKDIGADITVVARKLDPIRILSDVLEFSAAAELQKLGKPFTTLDRKIMMAEMMKVLAENIRKEHNSHN